MNMEAVRRVRRQTRNVYRHRSDIFTQVSYPLLKKQDELLDNSHCKTTGYQVFEPSIFARLQMVVKD